MNAEVRARWVAALRSGRYARGTGLLKITYTDGSTYHCCLGVLCELAVQDGLLDARVSAIGTGKWHFRGSDGNGSTAVLPRVVQPWAGLSSCDPGVVGNDGVRVGLSVINDSNRYEFDGIADLIEVQL